MLSNEFLTEFKRATEARWRDQSINPTIYGFQFQPGTRWNPGLSHSQIADYERILGVYFPYDLKAFLAVVNGTDLPVIDIRGSSDERKRQSVGVYSYPRDLVLVQDLVASLKQSIDRSVLAATMAEEGFELSPEASFLPIYAHRYVICTTDLDNCAVLSIWDERDAIVYGRSLREYLDAEFLQQ